MLPGGGSTVFAGMKRGLHLPGLCSAVEVGRELEQRVASLQADLNASDAQVHHLGGQLVERSRELITVRDETSAALTSAQGKAQAERETAESLRQDLARATLRLEALPRLESQLEDLDRRLSAASNSQAEAAQAAAVATATATAESKRADDAAQREVLAGGQLDKLGKALEDARQLERSMREQAQIAAAASQTSLPRPSSSPPGAGVRRACARSGRSTRCEDHE